MIQVQEDIPRAVIGYLYQQHARAIFSHCRGLLGQGAEAADALQETIIRVLRRERIHSAICSVRYLYRTSTNACVD